MNTFSTDQVGSGRDSSFNVNGQLDGLLDQCASVAMARASDPPDDGNAVGLADLAQFLSCWGRQRGDQQALAAADVLANKAVALLGEQALPPHWIGGFCGITWSLRDSVLPAAREIQFSDAVDEVIEAMLNEARWYGQFDLICGLNGYGVYGLEHPDPDRGARMADAVVRHLSQLASTGAEGYTWRTPPNLLPLKQRERLPDGCHNLGLAHGVPGVLAFLARSVERGTGGNRAVELLQGGIQWLVAQREQDPARSGYHFRNVVEEQSESRPLAWCYGDLGVSLALFRVGQTLSSDSLRQLAITVARDSTQRDFNSASVVDAGLCHGAAGAALVFHRFWQVSNDEVFRHARDGWMNRILSLVDPQFEQSAGVFICQDNGSDVSRTRSLNRLTGLAGVGLTLMTCLDELNSRWDAPLMTDIHRSNRVCR